MRKRISRIMMIMLVMTFLVGFGKEEKIKKNDTEVLAQLEDCEFIFSSGVGAWRDTLYIAKDGTFVGMSSDSDAGFTGAGYPNGTRYFCEYYGSFTEPKKVNDYTYSMTVKEVHNMCDPNTSEIKNGILYEYGTPNLKETEEVLIYLPGAPLSKLPQDFLTWAVYNADELTELPYYGLYDVNQRIGFSSHTNEKEFETDLSVLNMQSEWTEKMLKHDNIAPDLKAQKAEQLFRFWNEEGTGKVWSDINKYCPEMAGNEGEFTREYQDWTGDHDYVIKNIDEASEGTSEQKVTAYQEGVKVLKEQVYHFYLRLRGQFY